MTAMTEKNETTTPVQARLNAMERLRRLQPARQASGGRRRNGPPSFWKGGRRYHHRRWRSAGHHRRLRVIARKEFNGSNAHRRKESGETCGPESPDLCVEAPRSQSLANFGTQ